MNVSYEENAVRAGSSEVITSKLPLCNLQNGMYIKVQLTRLQPKCETQDAQDASTVETEP